MGHNSRPDAHTPMLGQGDPNTWPRPSVDTSTQESAACASGLISSHSFSHVLVPFPAVKIKSRKMFVLFLGGGLDGGFEFNWRVEA